MLHVVLQKGVTFFVIDLPLVATHNEIDMYADDSTVTSIAKTTEEINGYLNTDMKESSKLLYRK